MLCCTCTCVWSQRDRHTYCLGLAKIKIEIKFNHTCWKVCSSVHPLVKCIGKMYFLKNMGPSKMSLHPSYPSKCWSKAVAAAGGRWVQGGAALQVTLKQQVSCSKELDLRGTRRPHRHIALHSSHTLPRYIFQYSRHFTMALGLRVRMQIHDMLPHCYLSVMSV